MNYLHSQSEASHENTFFSSCLNMGEDQDKTTKMLPTPFFAFPIFRAMSCKNLILDWPVSFPLHPLKDNFYAYIY